MRVLFLLAVAIVLVGQSLPASAYTCTEWCHINRCDRGVQTGSVPVRVCSYTPVLAQIRSVPPYRNG